MSKTVTKIAQILKYLRTKLSGIIIMVEMINIPIKMVVVNLDTANVVSLNTLMNVTRNDIATVMNCVKYNNSQIASNISNCKTGQCNIEE